MKLTIMEDIMDIIDFAEASELLKISHPTLYRWVNEGKVRAFKVGRQWRFYRNDLLDVVNKSDVFEYNEFDGYIDFFKKRWSGKNINNISSDNFFHFIIMDAFYSKVNIFHISPVREGYGLFYRISGELIKIRNFSESISSILKSEIRKIFQSEEHISYGKLTINGEDVFVKLVLLKTVHGERYTFNILNKLLPHELGDIFLLEEDREIVRQMTERKNGILLITGPSGSGKSTTAYGIIGNKSKNCLNVISIDEDINTVIEGINHVTEPFSENMLKKVIKSDADIIMAGTLSNRETFEFVSGAAARALVITEMNAWGVFNTIKRIYDFNVSVEFFDYLKGIISQKLLRKICRYCKDSSGCPSCNYTGYEGFFSIYEMLNIDNEIKEMIILRKPIYDIKEKAIKKGMKLFYERGKEYLLKNMTTEMEVRRVIGQDPESIVF